MSNKLLEELKISRRLYMDIHALQSVPASCINRDDTGSPKEVVYGGKIRGRVSSQAWKRAIRMYFAEHGEEIGIRTKLLKGALYANLVEMGNSEKKAEKEVENAVKTADIASSKSDKEVMTFVSETQIDALTAIIDRKIKEGKKYPENDYKKDLKQAVTDNPTSDMLLFGRMMASDISLNYDAAVQMAPAFTVDEAREEYDYFTAVDDLKQNQGAGHLDTKSYNSGVYYRYTNINLSDTSELIKFDKEHAASMAKMFLESFVYSMPTGSINNYANCTLPDAVTVILRTDRPVSYAPAFGKAIKGEDHMESALKAFDEYDEKISNKYNAPLLKLDLRNMSLAEMADTIEKKIQEMI